MEDRKIKQLIRIFEDGGAELLEGKALKNFIARESAALALLVTHSWAYPKKGEIKWVPLEGIEIIRHVG